MKNKKNHPESSSHSRRDFIVRTPMAAAALILSGSFGFPVTTEAAAGTLLVKIDGPLNTIRTSTQGVYKFSPTQIENLKAGRFQALEIKWEISSDNRTWQAVTVKISDSNLINKLTEIAKR